MSTEFTFVNLPRGVNIVFPIACAQRKPNLLKNSRSLNGKKSPDFYVKVMSANGITVGHVYYDEEDKPTIDQQLKAFCDLLTIRLENHDGDPFSDVPF